MIAEPIAAVLFDLDGTLVDTAPDFVRILNQLRILPHDLTTLRVEHGQYLPGRSQAGG